MNAEQLAPVTPETRRTFDGIGRHALRTDSHGALIGSADDIRKVLRRAHPESVILPFDSLTIDPEYVGRHRHGAGMHPVEWLTDDLRFGNVDNPWSASVDWSDR